MRTNRSLLGMVLVLLALSAVPAAAQVHWESPLALPPRDEPGLGLYLIDASGGGIGVMAIWRTGLVPSIGLRGGIAEDRPGGGVAALFGADVAGSLVRQTAEFPLEIDWVLGAGASAGNRVRVDIPLGITVGHRFAADNVRFLPYLSPRVVAGGTFGAGGRLGLDFAVDLGIDIGFQPTWTIRFAGTFGDRSALGIGIVF